MKIGILAVQGAFIEHEQMLKQLDADCIEIRKAEDLSGISGIVLPGGESTVQGRLLHELNLFEPIREKIAGGLPVLATCAGLILLAKEISNDTHTYLATLPVCVRRNAYGRQLGSFSAIGTVKGYDDFEMTFIRAPYVESAEDGVEVLATVDEKIVAVQYQSQIGLAFHPELGSDLRIHRHFLSLAEQYEKQA